MRTVVCSILFLLPAALAAADHTTDTPEQVKKAIAEKKAVLIDVREPREWQAGHLKDAELLPLSKLKKGVAKEEVEKVIPKGKIAYLHCKAGGRCLIAADILQKQGYDVRALKEGYDDLIQAGFPKAK
jgi:rhodanese-related sulfurtransferase